MSALERTIEAYAKRRQAEQQAVELSPQMLQALGQQGVLEALTRALTDQAVEEPVEPLLNKGENNG